MGAAIDFLRERGLTAKAQGKRIIVSLHQSSPMTCVSTSKHTASNCSPNWPPTMASSVGRTGGYASLIAVPSSWLASPALMPKRWRTRRGYGLTPR